MKTISVLLALASGFLLQACQSTPGSSFADNPTDSGSRYSDYSLSGSRMAEQNVDLED